MAASLVLRVEDVARLLRKSPAQVRRMIRRGEIVAKKHDGRWSVDPDENPQLISSAIALDLDDAEPAYVPSSIAGYNAWHEVLDEFVWLLKAAYASRDDLRQKRFRLDALFARYIAKNRITLPKIRASMPVATRRGRVVSRQDLKRGWYNALAFCSPSRPSRIGLSFRDIEMNSEASDRRLAFASWKIAQAYYAMYFYLRSVVVAPWSSIDLSRHASPMHAMHNNAYKHMCASVWRFPFTITVRRGAPFDEGEAQVPEVDYWKYMYAQHPRQPWRSPAECTEHVFAVFRKFAGRRRQYCLWDFMHDFRIWANYRDIDNLLSLWGAGYKGFMDQALSAVEFFVGGMSELVFMAREGEARYFAELKKLYEMLATSETADRGELLGASPFVRLEVYRQLGLVGERRKLRGPDDPNRVAV